MEHIVWVAEYGDPHEPETRGQALFSTEEKGLAWVDSKVHPKGWVSVYPYKVDQPDWTCD
jgi:hypothetical protein